MDLVQARQDYDRFTSIDPHAVTRQQVDNATATYRSAQAKLDAAHQTVEGANAQVAAAAAQQRAAETQVQAADANVAAAELQLSYCTIVAPVTGRIGHRTVGVGNYVNPGQALFAIVQDDMWVTANFKETQLADIRPGQPVDISIDAIPPRIPRPGGQLPARFRDRVQPAAGRERDRQLRQDRRTAAREDRIRRRSAEELPGLAWPVGGALGAGALMADPRLPRSAAGDRSPWLIAVIVSVATFMEVLDVTIVNVALRHIAGSLATSQDESTWIVTSYLVSNAIVLPISGWLANVLGRKRFYMGCVALFTAASLLCAVSSSLSMILISRVLQGIGGGGLAPTEQSIFADTFPVEKRAQAFACTD